MRFPLSLPIKLLALVLLMLGGAQAAQAVPIPGLFTSGVDGSGSALGDGAADTHYDVLETGTDAIVVNEPIPGTWVDNSATARWIWQTATGTPVGVTRNFRLTFDLTGLDPDTASIAGEWATDNFGVNIRINGASTGNTCAGFTVLCSFSVGSGFQAGLNTIDFIVNDQGAIAGLLVASISGSAREVIDGGGDVPEPASLALVGVGLLGLGAARRSFRRA